jgi:hypothetical protein
MWIKILQQGAAAQTDGMVETHALNQIAECTTVYHCVIIQNPDVLRPLRHGLPESADSCTGRLIMTSHDMLGLFHQEPRSHETDCISESMNGEPAVQSKLVLSLQLFSAYLRSWPGRSGTKVMSLV